MKVKPLLKSAILFHPTRLSANDRLRTSMTNCIEWASELAEASGELVGVSLQHSLKHDEFAVMVECGRRTFSSHSRNPKHVFDDVSKKVFKHIERLHAAIEKEERSSRTKSGRGHRR